MTKQEMMELVLARVPEDKKEVFLEEVRDKTVKKDKAFLEKYGVVLTAEELRELFSNEITDEDLDAAAGGCDVSCCDYLTGKIYE